MLQVAELLLCLVQLFHGLQQLCLRLLQPFDTLWGASAAGDSCPHRLGTGDMSLSQYLLEGPLLGEAGAAGGLGSQGAVALGGGDTDLPGVRCALDDASPDSSHAPVGTGLIRGWVLPAL